MSSLTAGHATRSLTAGHTMSSLTAGYTTSSLTAGNTVTEQPAGHCLSACLPACRPTCVCHVCLSICVSARLYRSVSQPVFLLAFLHVFLPLCLTVCVSIRLFVIFASFRKCLLLKPEPTEKKSIISLNLHRIGTVMAFPFCKRELVKNEFAQKNKQTYKNLKVKRNVVFSGERENKSVFAVPVSISKTASDSVELPPGSE